MDVKGIFAKLMLLLIVNVKNVKNDNFNGNEIKYEVKNDKKDLNGVYSECFIVFSFPCIQRKTLAYLKQLNSLSEVSVIGDYVKFVRLNTTKVEVEDDFEEKSNNNSEELSHLIDKAIDRFFDNHIIRFSALGSDIAIPNNVEEFVGRKKRKGGGGGETGEHDGVHFTHKKMMMMVMMCMKMKLMMMMPAMMGMMGMMSFKGMMFSMMTFMVSKMMLLMKILEKKGGLGSSSLGGGGATDGGWAVGGGSGGAWMPAGGPDYSGGGGYDANGQWQSRSILETENLLDKPKISYKAPVITYINPIKLRKAYNKNNEVIKVNKNPNVKSRRKRSIIDAIQNYYIYWTNKLFGVNNNRRTSNLPKYKMVNGVKYIYYPYPYRQQKYKAPKKIQMNKIKDVDEGSPLITAADFNKGEIVEGGIESRMIRKKFHKMKDTVNETLDDNPWE